MNPDSSTLKGKISDSSLCLQNIILQEILYSCKQQTLNINHALHVRGVRSAMMTDEGNVNGALSSNPR